MSAPLPPPGWYPDPTGQRGPRGQPYWDGQRWSDAIPPTSPKAPGNTGISWKVWAAVGGGILLLVVIGSISAGIKDDRSSSGSTSTTSSSHAAPPTSRNPDAGKPTMNPTPGAAYKIDDCFLCTEPPGTWKSAGPVDPSRPCVWRIQRDLVGDMSSLIDAGSVGPGEEARVRLDVGQYFGSTNCHTWIYVG